MKDKVKKVKVELIAKELMMSERHQVKLVKIEIFRSHGREPRACEPVTPDVPVEDLFWAFVFVLDCVQRLADMKSLGLCRDY